MSQGRKSPYAIPAFSLGMKPYIFLSVILVILYILWTGGNHGDKSEEVAYVEAPAVAQSASVETLVAACAECHGEMGDHSTGEEPFIAGQNIDYLVFAMRTYTMGIRQHAGMEQAILDITLKDVKQLAAYYASQEAAWRGRDLGVSGFVARFDPDQPLAGAQQLAAQRCERCHHQGRAGVPHLNGLSFDYMVEAMEAYQSGRRDHGEMAEVLAGLTRYDFERLGFYYAQQSPMPPQEGTRLADDDHQVASCNECHGKGGNSRQKRVPSLAGQERDYLVNATRAYGSGERNHPAMAKAVASLSDEAIDRLAQHYATLDHQPQRVRQFKHPRKLSKVCNTCHGYNGHSQNASRPMISGQTEGYLIAALNKYRSGERDNSAMHKVTQPLSQLEILAIADFYASQQ